MNLSKPSCLLCPIGHRFREHPSLESSHKSMIVDAHRGAHNIKLRENNGVSIYNQVPSRAQVVSTLRTGYPRVQASSHDNGSRLEAAPGPSHVPVAPAPASRLGAALGPPRAPAAPAPASRLGEASGPPHVTWAPAPTF
jgi:hypothetical protein